jgi:hypothetical protein
VKLNSSYQWLFNGTELREQTLATLRLPNITSHNGGEYTCSVSNNLGFYRASTFLFVYPYFLSHPDDMQVSIDSDVVLTCLAVGFPSPEYLWQRADGRKIRNDLITNVNYLSITGMQYGDAGEYYCVASGRGNVRSRTSIISGISYFRAPCIGMTTCFCHVCMRIYM